MKIIFDNYIKDFDIELYERPNNRPQNSSYFISTGRISLSFDVYIDIARNENNLLSHSFSIVNDELRQYYQKCNICNIQIVRKSNTSDSILIEFVVMEVGLSSIPLPDLEESIPYQYVFSPNFYYSTQYNYSHSHSPVLTPSGGVL